MSEIQREHARAAPGEPGWIVVLAYQDGGVSKEGCRAWDYTAERLVLEQTLDSDRRMIIPVPGNLKSATFIRNDPAVSVAS